MRRGHVDIAYYPFRGELNPSGYSLVSLKSTSQPRAISEADLDGIKKFGRTAYPKFSRVVNLFLLYTSLLFLI